jgi:hypothetical protein
MTTGFQKASAWIDGKFYSALEAKVHRHRHVLHFGRFAVDEGRGIARLERVQSFDVDYDSCDLEVSEIDSPVPSAVVSAMSPDGLPVVDDRQPDEGDDNKEQQQQPFSFFRYWYTCPASKHTRIVLEVVGDGSGGWRPLHTS